MVGRLRRILRWPGAVRVAEAARIRRVVRMIARVSLQRRPGRQSDLIARPDIVRIPPAMTGSIEVEDAVLATRIELWICLVQVLEACRLPVRDVPQRIAALHGYGIGVVICRRRLAFPMPGARGLQVLIE